jgi:signal transduction histidine kinase
LTFCKLVLDAHGQEIWIEPDGPLPGACFAFTLPLA